MHFKMMRCVNGWGGKSLQWSLHFWSLHLFGAKRGQSMAVHVLTGSEPPDSTLVSYSILFIWAIWDSPVFYCFCLFKSCLSRTAFPWWYQANAWALNWSSFRNKVNLNHLFGPCMHKGTLVALGACALRVEFAELGLLGFLAWLISWKGF